MLQLLSFANTRITAQKTIKFSTFSIPPAFCQNCFRCGCGIVCDVHMQVNRETQTEIIHKHVKTQVRLLPKTGNKCYNYYNIRLTL